MRKRTCKDCAHYIEWIEYGNVLGDCGNKEAFEFIGNLDGVEDPAAAACPFYAEDTCICVTKESGS